jgi:hypothetical protein
MQAVSQAVSWQFPTAKSRAPSQVTKDFWSTKWTVPASILIRGSAVGIATGYGLDDRGVGVRVPIGSSIFTSPYRPGRNRSTQSHVQWVPGGVKRQGREADHLPPTSAEVKKTWIYTTSPPHPFME